ncbi:hypothetical protein ACLOJK_010225 [Asimina triloba]
MVGDDNRKIIHAFSWINNLTLPEHWKYPIKIVPVTPEKYRCDGPPVRWLHLDIGTLVELLIQPGADVLVLLEETLTRPTRQLDSEVHRGYPS